MIPEREQPNRFNAADLLITENLITLKQASEKSGFSTGYLRSIAQRGRLQAKKLDNSWLTSMDAIEEYKRSRLQIIKKL